MITEIIDVIIWINTFFALLTVFRQKRDIAATWAWLLVLSFLPVVGFIAYAFLGRKLPKKRLFRFQEQNVANMRKVLDMQLGMFKNAQVIPADKVAYKSRGLIRLFDNMDNAFLTRRNDVQIFTDGNQLFDQMFTDIKAAKQSINIEFYTFYSDQIGTQVLDQLVEKAKQGVSVRVIYDSWGSMGTNAKFFKPLVEAGGNAEPFLHTHSAILDFRINFRDHRKIVVIDGKVGYVGGFNIGDQYLGRKKKFGNWRDTHIRVMGAGVFGLQSQFILDWNATDDKHQMDDDSPEHFPVTEVPGTTDMQIVTSGPDSDMEQIKVGYIKLIQMAERTCWIQSPYLIPDDSMIDALRIAAMSGVDVRIMVPCKPDHPFVYRATQYYAHQLAEDGVKIYFYQDGFIHAKTMVIDGQVGSVGSANLDYRSFKLNFEVNAFMYDEKICEQLESIYRQDMAKSKLMTPELFSQQPLWTRFKQQFSRLFAPIL
ncbi:cardiolipin synthase [Nicoliella spurrieriana]|uniref:Cardiolipin synthase n=1 Tax=Nicoliella spurrieriana TaxID=2925830 RepID=A0A976X612_9LACO|nr:cardiolipin synthase [Nicoliella spurrieriana]UQS87224.1 cardiolipin synthase [Nicoliella spurrieriana]